MEDTLVPVTTRVLGHVMEGLIVAFAPLHARCAVPILGATSRVTRHVHHVSRTAAGSACTKVGVACHVRHRAIAFHVQNVVANIFHVVTNAQAYAARSAL